MNKIDWKAALNECEDAHGLYHLGEQMIKEIDSLKLRVKELESEIEMKHGDDWYR